MTFGSVELIRKERERKRGYYTVIEYFPPLTKPGRYLSSVRQFPLWDLYTPCYALAPKIFFYDVFVCFFRLLFKNKQSKRRNSTL